MAKRNNIIIFVDKSALSLAIHERGEDRMSQYEAERHLIAQTKCRCEIKTS